MKGCILSIFWPKKDIVDFMKKVGCTSRELMPESEYKELHRAEIVDKIFTNLEKRSDSGIGQFRCMLKELTAVSYTHLGNILNAANAVIRNNHGRKEKTLWTENEDGNMIQFRQFDSAYEEAEYVVGDIRRHVNKELCSYKDNAVLYRTNAQSRMFEERFVRDSRCV